MQQSSPNLASEVMIHILDAALMRNAILVAIISVDGDPGIGYNLLAGKQGRASIYH